MASLVVSVMSRFAPFPPRSGAARRTTGAGSRQRPEAMFPAVLSDDGRFAASRQAATVASRTFARKGFCRLVIAPSLVAMVRKFGPFGISEGRGRPDIAIIGSDGLCWRTSRSASNPSMPGMKMSRNNRSNVSAWTRSRPRRPSLAATTAWPAPSRRNRSVACTAWSSSTRRIFARAAALPESRQRKVESLPGRTAMRNSFGVSRSL